MGLLVSESIIVVLFDQTIAKPRFDQESNSWDALQEMILVFYQTLDTRQPGKAKVFFTIDDKSSLVLFVVIELIPVPPVKALPPNQT